MSETMIIKPCPFCGYKRIYLVEVFSEIWARCDKCKALGPTGATDEEAIRLWNNMQAATRKGEPVESEF